VKVTVRTETKSTKITFFGYGKYRFDKKISLQVSDFWVNPACLAGVRTSRLNFRAR
jgi:hypothetical protein